MLWLVSRLLRSNGGSRRQRRSARRGSPRRPSRPQDRTAATTDYASVGLTFSWRNDQRNDQSDTRQRPRTTDPPVVQEVVDLAVERRDLAVARLAALPGRLSHAEEPLAFKEPSGVLRGFRVARWSSSSQGRSTRLDKSSRFPKHCSRRLQEPQAGRGGDSLLQLDEVNHYC